MKKDMVDLLCCPNCKGELRLSIKIEKNGSVKKGSFICKNCGSIYQIRGDISDFIIK